MIVTSASLQNTLSDNGQRANQISQHALLTIQPQAVVRNGMYKATSLSSHWIIHENLKFAIHLHRRTASVTNAKHYCWQHVYEKRVTSMTVQFVLVGHSTLTRTDLLFKKVNSSLLHGTRMRQKKKKEQEQEQEEERQQQPSKVSNFPSRSTFRDSRQYEKKYTPSVYTLVLWFFVVHFTKINKYLAPRH